MPDVMRANQTTPNSRYQSDIFVVDWACVPTKKESSSSGKKQ